MNVAGWGAVGAARDPPAEEFCSETAVGKALPALPREQLGTTLSPHQRLALPAKGFGGFHSQRWVFTRGASLLPGPAGGSRHVLSPLAGTLPQGASRGSHGPQAPGLPRELSPPACTASGLATALGLCS